MSNVTARLSCILLLFVIGLSQTALSQANISDLKQKAQGGDPQAQTQMGLAFRDNNPDAAAEWFRKAAEQGNPIAQNDLGVLYHIGRGVPKDLEQAFGWYKKSAAQKYGPGVFNVAISYYNGDGVPEDMVTAYAWMLLADELGEKAAHDAVLRTGEELAGRVPEGELKLAAMLDSGGEFPKDEAAASKWYHLAADHGSAEAQVRYGLMMADGRGGTARDPERAYEMISRAAEQRSGPAMFTLGYAYQRGTLGRPVNYGEAIKWYEKAAAAGHPAAMVNLGLMNTDGTAGVINYQKAYFWLYMADAFNIPQAKNSIPIVTAHLSQKQVKEAQENVAAWWQKNGKAILVRRPDAQQPVLVRSDPSAEKTTAMDLPPQNALPPGVFRVGGDVLPPKLTYGPDPRYDEVSRKHHTAGTVILRCVVGPDGLTRDIELIQALTPELDEEAVETLKQWKFSPATKQGQPVAVMLNFQFNFNIH
jgi:TonB family protein